MKHFRLHAIAACVVAIAVAGCGKEQPAPGAPGKASVAAAEDYHFAPCGDYLVLVSIAENS